MNAPIRITTPELLSLFAQFPLADADLPEFESVSPEEMPAHYRTLLVHEHHMTVTVEAHHGELVDVHPLATYRGGSCYARKIILTTQQTGKVVLFAIVRINLDYCRPPVRERILQEKTPLGRILIEHNVLRRIEPTEYFKVCPGPVQSKWFKRELTEPLYGRLGFIYCDEQPTVELLEIVMV
jgi:chorismate-pyruvate lyase